MPIASSWVGRFIEINVGYGVSAVGVNPGGYASATARLSLAFFNGSSKIGASIITSDNVSASAANPNGGSRSGTFSISHSIPSGCDSIRVGYSINGSVSNIQDAASNRSMDFGGTIVRIIGSKRFLSAKGLQLISDAGKRVKLDRDNGLVAGNELVVEGDNGHEAHLVMNGGTLEFRDASGNKQYGINGF